MSDTDYRKLQPETVERIRSSFLILRQDLISHLETLEAKSPSVAILLKNARDGLHSVASAGSLPFQLVSHAIQQRHFDRIHSAERILNWQLSDIGNDPSYESKQKSLHSARKKMDEFIQSKEGINNLRDSVILELNFHLDSKSINDAAFELLVQTLISTWAVFESSLRTFIIAWINADPQRASPVLASQNLKNFFGKQVVDIAVISEHASDLSSSMGDILFKDRKLDSLTVIRDVLEALFNAESIRSALAGEMWILNQRRHLFVHRRGLVDSEYLERTGDNVPIGERLAITSGDVERHLCAVHHAFVTIAKVADGIG